MMRRRIRIPLPPSGGGGGGPTPTPAFVAWGPDFGGVDGDRYTINVINEGLGMIMVLGDKTVNVDELLSHAAADYNTHTVELSQTLTMGPVYPEQGVNVTHTLDSAALVYNAQTVTVDERLGQITLAHSKVIELSYLMPALAVENEQTITITPTGALAIIYETSKTVEVTHAVVQLQWDYHTAGSFTFTAPYTGTYRCDSWGGGGGAGGGGAATSGGGGAGGQFARTNSVSRSAAQTFTVNVAALASGGALLSAGTTGNDSWISTTGSAPTATSQGCLAKGGGAGAAAGALSNGAGGTATTSGNIGDTIFNGANGASGGVGGGGAGSGGNASGQTGGAPDGGDGGAASTAGDQPGGGGGGGGILTAGGDGAPGWCSILYVF